MLVLPSASDSLPLSVLACHCDCSHKCPKCNAVQLIMDTQRPLDVTVLLYDRIQRGVLVSEQNPDCPGHHECNTGRSHCTCMTAKYDSSAAGANSDGVARESFDSAGIQWLPAYTRGPAGALHLLILTCACRLPCMFCKHKAHLL
jgi:hypothetical protein